MTNPVTSRAMLGDIMLRSGRLDCEINFHPAGAGLPQASTACATDGLCPSRAKLDAQSHWKATVLPALRGATRVGARVPLTLGALLAFSIVAGTGAVAAPALEYGPEVEARFLESCSAGRDADHCRCVLERMQGAVGIELFHEIAEGGPDRLSASSDAVVRTALRRVTAACARGRGAS